MELWRIPDISEAILLLSLLLLGDVTRHPHLALPDVEQENRRLMWKRAAQFKWDLRRKSTLFHFGQHGGHRPLHALFDMETTACLWSALMAVGFDDFPWVICPSTLLAGRPIAWPFTPSQGHILLVVAQALEQQRAGSVHDEWWSAMCADIKVSVAPPRRLRSQVTVTCAQDDNEAGEDAANAVVGKM